MGQAEIKFLLDRALIFGIAVVGAIVIVWILRALRKARRRSSQQAQDLAIDISALGADGPPASGPSLTYYNTPVRVVVAVIAPAGRESKLPSEVLLPATFDHLLPGLAQVFMSHNPTIVCWPPQLSGQGFVRAFFHNAALPGDRGKGTPWLSIAGRFEAGGQRYLAGIVCCSETANNFGETEVERPGGWIDVLRVVGE